MDGLDVDERPPLQLSATYLDSDDLRLTRWDVSLRHRSNDGWTVKLPGEGDGAALVRDEFVFGGEAGRPPAEAVDLVRAFVRTAALRPHVRLKTLRRQTLLRDGEGQVAADITDDEVAVLHGRKIVARFRELEVEIAGDGDLALLDALVARLREAGAGPPDPTPKVVRALGPRASQPSEIAVAPLGAGATTADVVRAAIAASVERLVHHDPVVRLDADIEGVHQVRVATRRLRSDLRTFGALLDPDWALQVRGELSWLGQSLGVVRDGDVLLARLRKRVAGLPAEDPRGVSRLLATLKADRDGGYRELLATLRSDRYLTLLDDLVEAARAPALLPAADGPAAAALAPLVRGPLRKLRKDVAALGDPPEDEELHAIRIRAKRARYAAEAVAPILGKRARAVAAAAAGLQGVLGEHHDAVVAEQWLRDRARRSRSIPAAFAAGELAGLERAAAERARGRWPKAWKEVAAALPKGWA